MTRVTLSAAPMIINRQAAGPTDFGFFYDKATGQRGIPIDVDRKYRKGLLEAAAKAPHALWHFRNALDAGPDREGAQGAIRYFGNDLDLVLKLTAQMVDVCEVAMPGFKKWLHVTGYGNDKTMIRGFAKWAEYQNAQQIEHVLPAVRKVMSE
jgi:hypothetical protein